MVTVAVNGPTSGPPEPVNVKVPPDDGIPPAARIAPYSPVMPSCMGSGIAGPAGRRESNRTGVQTDDGERTSGDNRVHRAAAGREIISPARSAGEEPAILEKSRAG